MKKHRHGKWTPAPIRSHICIFIHPNFVKRIIKLCIPSDVVLTIRVRENIDVIFDRNQYLTYRLP